MAVTSRTTSSADMRHYFDRRSRFSPCSPSGDAIKIDEFSPAVFAQIRELNNVTAEDIIVCLILLLIPSWSNFAVGMGIRRIAIGEGRQCRKERLLLPVLQEQATLSEKH
jgi:hypothetical protein